MNTDNFAIWQRRECLPACVVEHGSLDAPSNRQCVYDPLGVPLVMHQAYRGKDGAELATVNATVVWEPREIEPHIDLSMPSQVESLTLEEAERLSSLLARLVHESREAAKEVDWR